MYLQTFSLKCGLSLDANDQLEQRTREFAEIRLLEIHPDGPLLQSSRDATDLIGEALGQQVEWVLLPVSRLHEGFFDLRTGLAGEFFQKFVNYGLRLAIVGDLSNRIAASTSLRDLVREANRGTQVWFVADRVTLESRVQAVMSQANQQE
jgi:hypothetical protein